MSKILASILVIFLAACASKPYMSPTQNYALGKEDLRISGTLNQSQDLAQWLTYNQTNELVVWINGKEVIRGNLSVQQSGELHGKYKGHSVTALCSSERKTANWVAVSCPILIDEKRTVTLTF